MHAQQPYWANGIGGTGNDQCYRMIQDSLGSILITGSFTGINVDFDPGNGFVFLSSAGEEDIFLAKYNADGEIIWAESMGGSLGDIALGLSTDQDGNIYISGYFFSTDADFDPGPDSLILPKGPGFSDIFLAKYAPGGHLLKAWNVQGTGFFCQGLSCMVSPQDKIVVAGYFSGMNVDFDPGDGTAFLSSLDNTGDAYIAWYNLDGTFVNAFRIGGNKFDAVRDLMINHQGNVMVCGNFSSQFADFDPGTGTANLSCEGTTDAFLAVYSPEGIYITAFNLRSTGTAAATRIVLDKTENVFLAGTFNGMVDTDPGEEGQWLSSSGESDVFLIKYDTAKQLIWAGSIGSDGSDYVSGACTDDLGYLYLTGSFRGSLNDFDPGIGTVTLNYFGNNDLFIAKYDPEGNYNRAFSINSPSDVQGMDLFAGEEQDIYITGNFSGTNVDFDPGEGILALSSMSEESDAFIAKYNTAFAGMDERQSSLHIKIYPNPVLENIRIQSKTAARVFGFGLYSSKGEIVAQGKGNAEMIENIFNNQINNLSNGLYLLKIFTGESSVAFRVMISHRY